MNNIPVFPVNSAQGLYDQLLATRPDPTTGRPDPAAVQAFMAHHPETARATALIKARTISSSFADSTFNSLNAFRFVNAARVSTPVRWAMEPLQPIVAEAPAQGAHADKNHLFDDMIAQLRQHPLKWRLLVTIGQPGDPTSDATQPWPMERQRVDAGTLTLDAVSSEDGPGACTDINYDPLVLPPGIEASDDPLLSARSAAYARSFTLRAEEREPGRHRVRSRRRKCAPEASYDRAASCDRAAGAPHREAGTLPGDLPVSALVDGHNGPVDVAHWHRYGGDRIQPLPCAGLDPQAAGHRDPLSGDHPLCQSAVESPSAAAGKPSALAAQGGRGLTLPCCMR